MQDRAAAKIRREEAGAAKPKTKKELKAEAKAEKQREKEIAKLEKNLQAINGKLGNARFVDNAPAEIVATERERQRAVESSVAALQDKLNTIKSLA